MSDIPSEPPPSYSQVTGSSTASHPGASSSAGASSHLNVPGKDRNGIPAERRRSMEDEHRPLPKGWVRTFDPETEHQFFVDTTKEPPRSIWTHPYDDEDYLRTLSSEERERIEQESLKHPKHGPTRADIVADHTDEEDHHDGELPPRPDGDGKGKGNDTRTFGRKFKDKFTGMTHEEREQERKQRAEEEQRLYEQHLKYRQAMRKALETGQPQFIGKDKQGKDVYIEPPSTQGSYGGYGGGGYGYNPYQSGIYSTPNARYIRPQTPYARPMGYGYGGGYGLPLAMGGGLMGGMMLGGMMGGGMGGFGGGGL